MKWFKFAETKKPAIGEVKAAAGEDIFNYFNGTHQSQTNPNDFWEKEKNRTMIAQVRAMNEADPYLWGMMKTRKQAVLGFDRQVSGEGVEADFVRDVLGRIKNFDLILEQMLGAIEVGFSITEIIWDYLGGKLVVSDLKPRCPDKFTFDQDWNLRLLTKGYTEGELMPDNKFIVFTWGGEYGSRYGSALYQKIYWYWYFAKNITKFWAIFTEKHASPTVVGKAPKIGGSAENDAKVYSVIKNLKSQSGIVLPDGYILELLEAERTGSLDCYENFAKWLHNGMAIAILGQSGTTESSDNGSYAKVAAQDNVRQDIIRSDISSLESVINDYLIRWLVDYNFENVREYPKWKIIYEDKPDIQMLANVTSTLVNAGDDRIPISWIHRKIGIPELVEGEPALVRPAQPSMPMFAEAQFKREQEIFLKEIKR